MRRYSVFHALPLSFFSRPLYREVAHVWRGAALLYLLLLVALPTVLVIVRMEARLTHWVHTDAAQVVAQIPPVHIRHGVVHVDRPLPVLIRDAGGKVLAVIDTTGSEATLNETGATVVLTRDHVYFHRPQGETRIYDLSTVTDFSFDRTTVQGWLATGSSWCGPIAFPFVLIGLHLFRLVQVLIGAGFALLGARSSRAPLVYAGCMRLVAVALTPALLVELVLDAAGARPPFWGALWSLIAIVYIVLVMLWFREDVHAAANVAAPEPGTQE